MPSVTQGIQSGYQIGRAFADPAPTEPSKMQSYVMKELIEGAYGVFRRKDGSVYVPQHFPKEARQLVIHKYIEKEKQASKEMFEEKKAKIEMVGKLQGVMEKVSEWGTDPKTKNFAIATYTQMIGEILGDKAQEMGVEKIADVATAAVTSQERKEAVDQKLYEILSGLYLKYNETNDIDYLNKYASLFAADPKKFKEWGLSNPQTKIEDHFEKLEKSATKQEETKKELKMYEEKRKLDAKYRQKPKAPEEKQKENFDKFVNSAQSRIIDKKFSLQKGTYAGLPSSAVVERGFAIDYFNKLLSESDQGKLTKIDIDRMAIKASNQASKLSQSLKGQEPGQYKVDGILVGWDGEELIALGELE
jgi:hypothetical protein